nr:transcription factor, MADS-box [Tanacetum cinerariifolium]
MFGVKKPMELINDSKKRKISFLRRKEGLIKKARELSTLCDVNVSMIICSDHQEGPEVFPRDHIKLNDEINAYKRKCISDSGKIKSYNLCDFFKDRKNKIEGELAKAKKSNLEAKYPTSFKFLDNSSEEQLRDFAYGLGMKLDQFKPLLNHNPITTMAHFYYNNNNNNMSIMSNSHLESSGSAITNVDNGFYPIMPMGQNDFGTHQRKEKLVVGNDDVIRKKLVDPFHSSVEGGHSGVLATTKRLSNWFYWKGMKNTVKKVVSSCDIFHRNKAGLAVHPGLLLPSPIPQQVWQDISMDFNDGLPVSNGKIVIMVVVDRPSKYAHFIPMAHPYTAIQVAQLFFDNVYKLH